MNDLDTLARAATRELLDHSAPDVSSRYTELGRIRARRTAAKLVGAAAAVALGIVGWQLSLDSSREIEPAPPTTQGMSNGSLLGLHDFTGDGTQTWGTAYVDLNQHLPTDADTAPLMQFSPDGRTLYYSDDKGELAGWDLASGTKHVLMACPELGCLGGSISPDGSTASFAGDGELLVADLATGTTTPLAVPVGDAGPVAWSPDGDRLAFLSSTGLWTMSSDGSDPVLVHRPSTDSSLPPYSVSWSPDGRRLAFFDPSEVAQGDATEEYSLMVVGADGRHPVAVHDVGCCAGDEVSLPSVAWSPDGSLLGVATSDLGGATGVYTVRPDGSQWTLRSKGYWRWLSWQPVAG